MISVIIPTRNRADLLALSLSSLVSQALPKSEFEILVVDNGSTDSTALIIKEYKRQLPNLRSIYAAEPGLHIGRHVGMLSAIGDLLVFSDDDIEALPTWLSSIKEAFLDPNVAMVGGNNYPMFLDTPPLWLINIWERFSFQGYKAIPSLSVIEFGNYTKEISPNLVWGCNFSIRKDVLIKAGGFHPDGMPQDMIRFRGDGETHVSNYVEKSDMKCIFHPGASVYHKVTPERMTFDYFRRRGFNQGVSDSYTQLRQKECATLYSNRKFIRRLFSFLMREIIGLFDSKDVKLAYKQLRLGSDEGRLYHQNIYRNDPEVRKWVHRSIYYEK
jgi:glucosyl-dolichyl phosphate glucuronosyltransferase